MPGPHRGVTKLQTTSAADVSSKSRETNASGRRRYLERAILIAEVTSTGHADNFAVLGLQKGAAEGSLAAISSTWSTDSDVAGQGTLTAGAPQSLTLTAASRWWESGEEIALVNAQDTTGVAVNVTLMVEWVEVP